MATLRTSNNYVEFIKLLSKEITLCRRKLRISKRKLQQRHCNYVNNMSLLVDETLQTHTLERLQNVKRQSVIKYARWLHDSAFNTYMADADTSDESDDESEASDESDISIITISDSSGASESDLSIITIDDSDQDLSVISIDDGSETYMNALTSG